MLNFNAQLHTSIGKRTFYFRQVNTPKEFWYQISVFGYITNDHFSMVKQDNAWVFRNALIISDWIEPLEGELAIVINKHQQE